jgi:hypothetical protein
LQGQAGFEGLDQEIFESCLAVRGNNLYVFCHGGDITTIAPEKILPQVGRFTTQS